MQKVSHLLDFLKYLIKNYPVWLLLPLITLSVIKIKRGNNSIFSILLILLNIVMIFLSDSHYIRYVLITVLARILLTGEFLKIFSEKFQYIIGIILFVAQLIINPPPISELKFKDNTIQEISEYIRVVANKDDVLLSNYGYFNFHSGLRGTSISGYISGGNVRTKEIDSDRLIKIIEAEKVKFILIHSEGRLYYPYGCELYYYEPHHIKGIYDFSRFENYLNENFTLIKRFESKNGPVFNLYQKK